VAANMPDINCGENGMDYEEIIEVIQQASGGPGVLSGEAAERSAQATLAERLPRAEAWHILQEVSAELKPWIYTETEAEKFDFDEFPGPGSQARGHRHRNRAAAWTRGLLRARPGARRGGGGAYGRRPSADL
jgi:hypothetical protein